jgi:precorrin-6A/cobalt-precorrin-6A reductase
LYKPPLDTLNHYEQPGRYQQFGMQRQRVLILGGTEDATELAAKAISFARVEVITSLAGRTLQPGVVSENLRIGGFGGVAGLVSYLREQQIDVLVDATHPFAAQISWNAAQAAEETHLPYLRLNRPPWQPVDGDKWLQVEDLAAAVDLLPDLAERIFLSIGRQELSLFSHLNLWCLMRMVEPPSPPSPLPPGHILLERGPFSLEGERSLLQQYEIGAIVSKNSGGRATYAKILAARELGIPVVMVKRPPLPEGETVADVESAFNWLAEKLMG